MDSFTMREQARGAADPAVCDVPTCIENEDAESSRNVCSRAMSTSNNGGQPGVPQSADDAYSSGREPRRIRGCCGRSSGRWWVGGSQRRWTREQFLNRKVVEPRGVKAVSETTKEKSSLIDSNPVMGTMAEAGDEVFAGHRDRLSEKRSSLGPCNSRVCVEKEDAESSRNACSRAKFGTSNKSTSSRLVVQRCAFVRRRASRFVSAGRTVRS